MNQDTPGNGATGEAMAAGNGADPEAAGVEPVADPIAALEAEKLDLKDRLMRALADMENVRRRAEREAVDARTYAVTGFARDMLTVADNIRRALESVPRGDPAVDDAVKPFVEGIELTERDLLTTLSRHGVKRLEPEGSRFDPNMHQAMFEVANETVPNGTVVQVIQTGYAIGDRVLRPALVGVAKGGQRPAPSSDAQGKADSEG
ncbi:nucleotide exchange factor GrpE [uncultured Enterovirga sp.]|uniref:nucleotide exchange factor GrpE n=1 Tax=uncultured Enterovirga sp. TaxID=2026352 RepID=UPI0035CA6FE5